MKSDGKTPDQIAAERAEAKQIASDILRLLERIPQRIVNSGGVALVRQYKAAVTKAKGAATATNLNLGKLRTAYTEIRSFYS